MRNILVILLVFVCSSCYAQKELYWLPEAYVKAALKGDTTADKHLTVVASVYEPFGNCRVLTGGDFKEVRTRKVIVDGKEKYELFDLGYRLNIGDLSREYVDKVIDSAKVYLSLVDERLLLEIVHPTHVERFYFIQEMNGFKFRDIYESMNYYYRLLNE